MFNYPDIDKEILKTAKEKETVLEPVFKEIDDISEANQFKVLNAFRKNRVSEACFNSGSGYGYGETGREILEQVYSDIFHTEDALVRSQITCGTHAIYLALSANLLPGEEILFASGKPYDSLEMSVGITPSACSLAEAGVTNRIVDLKNADSFDKDAIRNAINERTKIIAIQRSKGYKDRKSFTAEEIGEITSYIKSINPEIIVFVDNCYGEFVCETEPTDFGADLMAGSLIKNPGGGLAPTGGYIVGRADLIERCAFRLTAPGLGKEVGPSLGILRSFYQGLSLAPEITGQALKSAHFAAAMFEEYGYRVYPAPFEKHGCIVQAIDLLDPEKLGKFCGAIQRSSYVDSYVRPEGWNMPGYTDNVIMASGAFISGSSIELSADGPMREPYTVFLQGGLTYEHGKYAVMNALQEVTAFRSQEL